jgi:hypothetical protein
VTVSLRNSNDGSWVLVGTWFQQLAELPSALLDYQESNNARAKRILLAVPSRSLVATAIAWGFSKHAFENPVPPAESFPAAALVDVAEGTKVRIVFPVHPTLPKRQIRVGKIVNVSSNGKLTFVELMTNESTNKRALLPTVKYSLASEATPEGDYWEKLEVGTAKEAAKLNFFNSQQNPQALFLTEEGSFREELQFQFKEPSLLEELSVEQLSFEQANRLDEFANDKFSHFINTWKTFKDFDSYAPELVKQLGIFRVVVLDGNSALDSMSEREELRDSTILGIFETGKKSLQDRGAKSFLGEAMYSNPIEGFEQLLGWKAPDGIRIWGWS